MGQDDEKNYRCKDSMCWLVLSFFGLCCITFVVFLFICSMLFPQLDSDHQLGTLVAYPSNRIVFNMSDIRNSTESYIETLRNITAEYGCGPDDNDADCDCDFNTSSHFGEACSPDANFGYLRQQPCVLLRLDRVSIDWKPPNRWASHMPVACQGLRRVDNGRMRKYNVFPERGFASHYYTTTIVTGHEMTCRHPATLVAVHFPDLTTGTNISITCSVWVPNVKEMQRPSVTFSIGIF